MPSLLLISAVGAQLLTPGESHHVISRTSFGITRTQLVNIINKTQLDGYLSRQLTAPSTYSTAAAALMALFPPEPSPFPFTGHGWTRQDLENKQIVLALTSEHQLRELMTDFWERHFSTHLSTVSALAGTEEKGVALEWRENQGFRERALGTFADLLAWSMDSPAMRFYLDASVNCASALRAKNQNYAREVMELHTLGPGTTAQPNYTNDQDIPVVASILTGMRVSPGGDSVYQAACHDFSAKQVFTLTVVDDFNWVPPGPQTTVEQALEIQAFRTHLVKALQTKEFVCSKLIRFFVGDHVDADPALLQNCVAAWGTDGEIRPVLSQIFRSAHFRSATDPTNPSQPNPAWWVRIRTPLEACVAQARILEGSLGSPTSITQLRDRLTAIRETLAASGAMPFDFPSPDGFPFWSQRLIGTAITWQSGSLAYRIFSDVHGTSNPTQNLTYSPSTLLQAEVTRLGLNFANANHVAQAALRLQFATRFSPQDENEAAQLLNTPTAWQPAASDADRRIRLMIAFTQTIPQATEK